MRWVPFNDGYGIVGYGWDCECGVEHRFVSPGETMPCGFVVPNIDPDEWHAQEMAKPEAERAWNQPD